MQIYRSCDPSVRDAVELREALTRVLQSDADARYTNLQCMFDMPEGWFPDYLDDPPMNLRRGWRTHFDVALIRIGDRGILLLAETTDDTTSLGELEGHFESLTSWLSPPLLRSDRLATLPFIADVGRLTRRRSRIVVTRRGYEGLAQAVHQAAIDHLPETEDPSGVDALEQALQKAPNVSSVCALPELIDEFARLDSEFNRNAA